MTGRTMFGWRKVARNLASERDTTLLGQVTPAGWEVNGRD